MAKKQTRRSISVSGETYNAVRDYCDQHDLSASGLVTDLLNKYLEDNADGPPPQIEAQQSSDRPATEAKAEPKAEAPRTGRTTPAFRAGSPQSLQGSAYPDRRGPGFTKLGEGESLPQWLVTAQIEISRQRQSEANGAVEILLHNLIHRRMVDGATVARVELIEDE